MTPNDEIPRLIVGMPRSGTEWLTKRLNTHPEAAAFGETLFWGRQYIAPDAAGRYGPPELEKLIHKLKNTRLVSTLGEGDGCLSRIGEDDVPAVVDRALGGVTEPIKPGEAFMKLCHAIAQAEGKPCAIEKTTHHVNWVDRIVQELPESRFIVMLREPYGFMLSYKHQGDRRSPEIRRKIEDAYHPMWASLVWRGALRSAKHAAERFPEQAMTVWLHDMHASPTACLEKIQLFLKLRPADVGADQPRANSSFPSGNRPELKGEDIFWMNLINRSAMRREGIKPRRTPFAPLRIAWSILRLPVWALRNYLKMKKMTEGSVFMYIWRWIAGRR